MSNPNENILRQAKTLRESLPYLKYKELNNEEKFNAFYEPVSIARNDMEQDRTMKTALFIYAAVEPCHIIYSGHIGCGKSTELYRLSRMLKDEGYIVGIGDCYKNLDMKTVKYTDVILFILETLLKCADENGIPVKKETLENIEAYWDTVHTTVKENGFGSEISVNSAVEARSPGILAKVFSIIISVRGLLRSNSDIRDEYRRVIEPKFSSFIEMVNDVIDDIRTVREQRGFLRTIPVILLDQLEKADPDASVELFEKHSQELTQLHLHLIIPFPIEMCYKPSYNQIKNFFEHEWILPMIKLRNWEEKTLSYAPYPIGKEVLRSVINKRMDEKLFAEGVLDNMIEKTGGFLRHLLDAVFEAGLNASVKGGIIIDETDMNVSLTNLQASITRMFPDSGIPRLEKIINGEKYYASDEELMVFLRCGAVFEYNGKRWVDVHPLIFDWINETRAGRAE